MAVDAWGIDNEYVDGDGLTHTVPNSTLKELRRAFGELDGNSKPYSPVRLLRTGERPAWLASGHLLLEDGTDLVVRDRPLNSVPFGYHRFISDSSDDELFVIASPGTCHLPRKLKSWGWSAQLYAVRSTKSWGIGDFGDLRNLAAWSADLGASVLLLNPLHATAPILPQERSPYFPTSRRFRNPLYLCIEDVPGASDLQNLDCLAAAGKALNGDCRIDRDEVFRLKTSALKTIFAMFQGDESFEQYKATQGKALMDFAIYCAIAEEYGKDWRRWPATLQNPSGSEIQRFIASKGDRIDFQMWLQWLLDRQLEAASEHIALVQDLPVGIDPGGADAWIWQQILAQNVSIGLPADAHNTLGQNWGLPPWIPHRLQAMRYQPFIETVRATLAHAGGLRIDHALGLFRLFCIPEGMGPADGAFVRYPYEELLAIIALESHRANAFIVAEDLGPAESMVQEQLSTHKIMSYRVLWFEDQHPATYPVETLAAVATHDLPTIVGLWTGEDFKTQQALGVNPSVETTQQMRERLVKLSGLKEDADVSDVIVTTHRSLAEAESAIVIATLEDAQRMPDRPNIPATDAISNWSQALPQQLELIQLETLPKTIANVMRDRGRASDGAMFTKRDSTCARS